MPELNFYKIDQSIAFLLRKIESIQSAPISQALTDSFIPRPDTAIVFHFASKPHIISPKHLCLPRLFITKITEQPMQLFMDGRLDTLIFICNASVLSKMFAIDLQQSEKPFIEPENHHLSMIWNKMQQLSNNEEKIALFTKEIKANYSYNNDYIDKVYAEILNNSHIKTLQEIIADRACSESCLQRSFIKRCGVSMKRLSRIARLHYIFEKMLLTANFNYRDLLMDSNFYDQSHFIKDFKSICGESPRQFFAKNLDICSMISGIYNKGNALR